MRDFIWGSLRGRLILSAAIGGIAGLLAIGFFLYAVFVDSIVAGFDDRLEIAIESLVTTAEIAADGSLEVSYVGDESRFERTYQGWYWQVAPVGVPANADGPLVRRSHSLGDWALAVPVHGSGVPGARASGTVYGPMSQKLRYVSTDFIIDDTDQLMRFTVAGDYAEVDQRIARFLGAMGASLAFMAGVLTVVLLFQLRFATAPMNRIRSALAEVRTGAEPRLKGRFLREVEPLVRELNALLAHNAEVVERARTQVGNLAHALKTPLSVLRNEADGSGGPLAEAVRRETDAMRRQVDHYLARARAAASVNVLGARADVGTRVGALVRTMAKIYAARGLGLDSACPDGLCFKGEAQDLDEMLGNLIDNACKWAAGRVRVTGAKGPAGTLIITVEDDGPGITQDEIATATVRGARLDERMPGSGLGLDIVADIAQLYAGRLDLGRSPLGGLKADLVLPAV